MASTLVCSARYEPPLALLRVAGTLTVSSAPELRAGLLKCLADQPSAVIVDATDLVVVDDIALTAFLAAARHAAAWPGIPILVHAGGPELPGLIRRLGLDRHVIVCATPAGARERATSHPHPMQVWARFSPTVPSVPAARSLVAETCQRWRLGSLAATAALLATELVTNAVRHAGTPIDLTVTRSPSGLHLAVRDYSADLPHLVGPSGEADPGGRGLLIVEAVATAWGCTPTADGKVTWASLSTRQPRIPRSCSRSLSPSPVLG